MDSERKKEFVRVALTAGVFAVIALVLLSYVAPAMP